ncbi:MAG TPA: SPASM domain-containing protein [Planctomycetota bacterium]|nr:SPASM domain-containing protein [Planctomycetota bacterium]
MPEKTQTVVAPRPGETRDCLDPWKMSFVHADGSVTLCCWSRPVGNIKDAPFADVLMNDAAREMRRGLLTGRIPEDCVHCPARSLVPVEQFRRKVEAFVADDGRQELLKLRGEHYALQEELVKARKHVNALLEHVANLEDERRHLRLHTANLEAAFNEVREGRISPFQLARRWTRGRLRRSALGRWWIARRATSGAAAC